MKFSESKPLYLLVIILSPTFSSCSTTSFTPSHDDQGLLPNDTGIVVLTHGRKKEGFGGEFVSYEVAHVEGDKLVRDDFLPAEIVRLVRPTGDLSKGYYGFMHMLELKEGRYYLIGRKGRGYDSMIPAGGIYINTNSSNVVTPILMEFSVTGGKVNYVGEIIVNGKPLVNDSISLNNKWERDSATAVKMFKGLLKIPYTYSPPKKVNTIRVP